MLRVGAWRLAAAVGSATRTGVASSSAASGCGSRLRAVSAWEAPTCTAWRRSFSSSDDGPASEELNPRVAAIADQIVELNLIEISQLTSLLRERLDLPKDYGVAMAMPAQVAGGAAGTDHALLGGGHGVCVAQRMGVIAWPSCRRELVPAMFRRMKNAGRRLVDGVPRRESPR